MLKPIIYSFSYCFIFSLFLFTGCKHYDANEQIGDIPVGVSVVNTNDYIDLYPTRVPQKELGILFYPGGAVAPEAYNKMLAQLVLQGYEVVTMRMPLDLAVLDANKGLKYLDKFAKIKRWAIMGHSLGGSMASDLVANNNDKFKGLIFLAAYSNKSLKNVTIPLLSLYGSNDKVLDLTKAKDTEKQPANAILKEIAGGNHAQFGSYGKQNGDGDATISESEQHTITKTEVTAFLANL